MCSKLHVHSQVRSKKIRFGGKLVEGFEDVVSPQRVQGRGLVGSEGEPPVVLHFYSFKSPRLA